MTATSRREPSDPPDPAEPLSLTHWEFAPVDLGSSLTHPKAEHAVGETLRSLGWSEADGEFSREDLNCIVPHRVGIFRRGSTLMYVPSSGFAVVRYEPSAARVGTSVRFQQEAVRQALGRRVELQREIERQGNLDGAPEITETVGSLRTRLRRLNRSTFRCTPEQPVHEYAFSVFLVTGSDGGWNWRSVSALYSPRDVGFSISNDLQMLPDSAEFSLLMANLSPVDAEHSVECYPTGEHLHAGWSTAVIVQDAEDTRDLTVTLAEFRVQSTWLAAYNTAQFASSISTSDSASRRGRLLRQIGAEFTQVVSRQGQRLGPNSPQVPSRIVEVLIETSELSTEVETADQALEAAYARKQTADDRHNARGRRLIELFALIFASSGLAQLLFHLPLTFETISAQAPLFATWVLLNCVGIYLVLRQRY